MEKYLEILRAFEACGGKGIIYGGCLRDHMAGVGPVKDIDIAIADTPGNAGAINVFMFERCNGTVHTVHMGDYGNYPDVLKSIAVETSFGIVVNFVVMAAQVIDPLTVATRCDFGICQIAHDGTSLLTTPAFDKDFVDQTFTYLRDPFDQPQLDRSLRRWDRFKEKFVGWTLVVPEDLEFD